MARKESVERANAKIGGFASAVKNVCIQYGDRNIYQAKVVEDIKMDLLARNVKDSEIEKVNIYIKPEENTAYYVVNDSINGQVGL